MVEHPLLEPCLDSAARQAGIPRRWDWVLDDFRRGQDVQLALFPGLRDYYQTSDQLLTRHPRSDLRGLTAPGYVPHRSSARAAGIGPRRGGAPARPLHAGRSGGGRIALMPAGSGQRSLYPSARSWLLILDALADAFPEIQIALIGKHTRDTRTTTSLAPSELAALLAHRTQPLDCFDIGLAEQLAVVEACDLFLAPHTGFGMAALAVGTPWLALSGGRWFEYFFNRVPFRSIIPDCERYPELHPVCPGPRGRRRRRRSAHAEHDRRARPR